MPVKHFRLWGMMLVCLLAACSLLLSGVSPPTVESVDVGEVAKVTNGTVTSLLVVAVVVALAGLVLVVAALLLRWRGRRQAGKAVSTSNSCVALEALPNQTLLKDGAYVVLQTKSHTATGNVYAARGTTPLQLCPHCKNQVEGEDSGFCAHCGADLLDMTLAYPKYVIRETADVQVFGVSSRLVALQLDHPGLLLPVDVFASQENSACYYRVEPPYVSATELSLPQRAVKVLAWGADLARGLAYLHQHNVVLRRIDLDHIAIDSKHARLGCIDNANIVPEEMRAKAETHFARNVQALGKLLVTILTGPAGEAAGVPDDVAALLARTQHSGMSADALADALEPALRALCAPENVRFQIGHLTDVGRVRSLNEDSVLAIDFSERFQAVGVPVGVFAVADGMGGHAAGDVASQLTVKIVAQQADALEALAASGTLPDAGDWVQRATVMANYAVYAERSAADSDMGCTLVLALVIGDRVVLTNIGDSRAYWLSEDGIRRITTDHSLVERLVEVGQITPEEARTHPQRNVIYRVVGDKPEPEFDLFEQALLPNEALLLCSDGLSGMLADEEIWEFWRAAVSPQAACVHLVDMANQVGGTDNISVVILQVETA